LSHYPRRNENRQHALAALVHEGYPDVQGSSGVSKEGETEVNLHQDLAQAMFDTVEKIHGALGIESTWLFVLVIALGAAILGGGAAWIVDRTYKRSPEYKAEHPEPKSKTVTPAAGNSGSQSATVQGATSMQPPVEQQKANRSNKSDSAVSQELPTVTQGAGSAFSVNQQGGVTAGTINVDTPPLKLEWTVSPFEPNEQFKYRQSVTVKGNVAFNPVSFVVVCDQEIKDVSVGGLMIRSDFGITAQSNKIGYVYYENPPLPPGVALRVIVSSTNPFSVLRVEPAQIQPRRNAADGS